MLPLLLKGPSCGHDFDFHLLSWMEAASNFRHGILHLHWARTAAWNAGEPRFVFYPPLSWTVGGWLGLALPWSVVPAAYTWLALVAAGLGMYRLARQFTSERAATFVALLYLVNPYLLFTAYERTAFAELLAAAWIPLLFAAILRRRLTVLSLALPVALLWLTNAPAAVMGSYALAILASARLIFLLLHSTPKNSSPTQITSAANARVVAREATRIAAGTTLGLALAAYFILPAAYERRWVEIAMAMVPGMRIADSFLFAHTADPEHDLVLAIASWIALATLAAAILALAAAWFTDRQTRPPDQPNQPSQPTKPLPQTHPLQPDRTPPTRQTIAALALLTTIIACLLLPFSEPLWRKIPELQFLQFPWRLVALLTTIAGAALAMAMNHPTLARLHARHPRAATTAALTLALALTLFGQSHFLQVCDADEAVPTRLAIFHAQTGSEPTDEYTPKDADNDVLAHNNPAWWLASDADAPAPTTAAPSQAATTAPLPDRFTVATPGPILLILNLRAYPAWQILLNGSPAPQAAQRPDGLFVTQLPAGPSTIELRYRQTPDETLGISTSLIALLITAWLAIQSLRTPRKPLP